MSEPVIVTTFERPDLVPLAAGWLWEAFWRHRGSTLPEVEALVATSTVSAEMPHCFVLLAEGEPVGTVSLIACDLDTRTDLTPWLAGMYVAPHARERGCATRLIRAVEAAAQAAGVATLWLYTHEAQGLYLRAGWASAENFTHAGMAATLMRRDLPVAGA